MEALSPRPRDNSNQGLRLVVRQPDEPSPTPEPGLPPDDVLMEALRSGAEEMASALCRRVMPQVERTIRRLAGAADPDREDLAQLALMELVSGIGRYRGECSLDTWAQTITAHVVFKHIRRRQLERRIFSHLLADDVGTATPVVTESWSVMRQLLARIGAHLDLINEERAWAFVLHDLLGYDLREVAEMTKTSVMAAQSRLSRGRRELHERIAADADLVHLLPVAAKEGQR